MTKRNYIKPVLNVIRAQLGELLSTSYHCSQQYDCECCDSCKCVCNKF